ncbi:MAG: thioredoxin family protein [Pseudomonadota bacterium]
MGFNPLYAASEPKRSEIQGLAGPTLLEFGTPWCGHCRAVQPLLAAVLAEHESVRHLKIEDGKGRRLGRGFRVTLWPTLVLLSDGQEVARLVRPGDAAVIRRALAQLEPI